MGDLKPLSKARMELEELYSGIPDDSVNLTFQDLASIQENGQEHDKSTAMETIQANKALKKNSSLNKLPSLDFNRGLQQTRNHNSNHLSHHVHDHHGGHKKPSHGPKSYSHNLHHEEEGIQDSHGHHRHHHNHMYGHGDHHVHAVESSRAYDDMSVMSMNSMFEERGGRSRRPGIPHSNICTVCSTYIYIFRHRCLVCGRAYCRNCASVGMGEMTEGRKCIQCLGRRFSQRYIKKAGTIGCCSRYPSNVKQAELQWAEKGPRRAGERANYSSIMMMSTSRSHLNNNNRPHFTNSNPPSFVSSPLPHSSYSPKHHHFPL